MSSGFKPKQRSSSTKDNSFIWFKTIEPDFAVISISKQTVDLWVKFIPQSGIYLMESDNALFIGKTAFLQEKSLYDVNFNRCYIFTSKRRDSVQYLAPFENFLKDYLADILKSKGYSVEINGEQVTLSEPSDLFSEDNRECKRWIDQFLEVIPLMGFESSNSSNNFGSNF